MGRCVADAGYALFQNSRVVVGKYRGSVNKASKLLTTTTGLIIACVALWSAIGAMMDGRKAVKIAEWTARKDYWEFCETIEDQEDGCDRVTKEPLGPPPHSFSGDNQQNGLLAGEARELLPAQSPGTGVANSSGVDFHHSSMTGTSRRVIFGSGLETTFDFKPTATTLPLLRMDTGMTSALINADSPTSVPSFVRPRLLPSIPAAIWPSDPLLIQESTPLPGFSCRICKATLKLGFDEPPEHPWDHNNCYFVSWCWSCIDEALYGLSHQRVDSPPRGMVLHINDILRINAETRDDGGEVDSVLTQISWQRNFNQVVEALLYRVYFVYNGDEKHGGPPYPDDGYKKRIVEPWINEIGGILCYWRRVEKEGRLTRPSGLESGTI
uniref:Uncharacterized protein n=1 Tax=Podospora bellae-mahoneyi TaxID=2093777 RepID=A0ABR0F9F5_9PEZI|nr:hypothetical protein QC761_601035 [Podospora bellae-mahoneyi]